MSGRIFNSALLVSIILISFSCEAPVPPTPEIDYTGQIDTIVDIDGNKYKTVGIGTQIWMAENLKVTRLNDGTAIPVVTDYMLWKSASTPAYCWSRNDSVTYGNSYGALYNYYVVETSSICTLGWHVPRKSEWKVLTTYLGGESTAAGKLKDYNSSLWTDVNNCIVNNYGFSALPGGKRSRISGQFSGMGLTGYWWTSTQVNEFTASLVSMSGESTSLSGNESNDKDGHSIRCVKDQ